MRHLSTILAGALLAILTAHAADLTQNVPRFQRVTSDGQNASDTNLATVATNAAEATTYLADDKRKLVVGDKISFRIVQDREPAKLLAVTDSGEVDIPYIGLVSVTGKTCKQLAEELKGALEKEYYYHATVIVGLDSVSKVLGRVYVSGFIRNQGALEIPPGENFTASKAILRAGGFAEFAKKTEVKVIRKTSDGRNETFKLNMEDILEKGRLDKDIPLQPDDVIFVPQKLINL